MMLRTPRKIKPRRPLEDSRLIGELHGIGWKCLNERKIFLEGSCFNVKEGGEVYKDVRLCFELLESYLQEWQEGGWLYSSVCLCVCYVCL